MERSEPKTDSHGNIFWYKKNEFSTLHRKYGPAAEYADGTKVWYHDGIRFEPSEYLRKGEKLIDSAGNKHWRSDGKLHRDDGPAVEFHDGTLAWFQHDKLHRDGLPAVEWTDGIKEWWIDGIKQHDQMKYFNSHMDINPHIGIKSYIEKIAKALKIEDNMKEKINVFEFKPKGLPSVVGDLQDALEFTKTHFESISPGDSITIKVREMTSRELEDLEEFDGY